ncbi:MAG TPA: hypothetical protein VJA18_02480, partial [Candidatus Nanoarchaeia archaeon]|nr:hypothetical protein [Candidatus Nanoarchaeia archaeon]
MAVFEKVSRQDLQKMKGFSEEPIKTVYEEARLKKGEVTLILYSSGKLLLQGKLEAVEKAAQGLEQKKIGNRVKAESFRKETGWIIGTDESLKGDTFGGLVVAGVKANDGLRQ